MVVGLRGGVSGRSSAATKMESTSNIMYAIRSVTMQTIRDKHKQGL